MMTGMMDPSWLWVLALNCLQNSIMFTPCCPRAGPTGGAGLAFPAGICNLTRVLTSFAIDYTFFLTRPPQARQDAPLPVTAARPVGSPAPPECPDQKCSPGLSPARAPDRPRPPSR